MMNVTSNHLLLAPILFTASVYLTILIRRKPNELFRVDPNRTGRKTLEEMMKAARYETSPLSNSKLFLEWCRSSFLAKMRSNKEYQEKVGIRNIRKANWQLLQEIDDREKKAKDEWKLSPSYNRFQLVSEKLTGIYKAVESMEQSILSGADTEKIKRIQTTLLPSKKSELRDLKEEYDSLCTLPLYREMVSSIDVAAQLRKKLGLVDAKAALLNTQKEIGHRKRDGGFGFEDVASDIIQVVFICLLFFVCSHGMFREIWCHSWQANTASQISQQLLLHGILLLAWGATKAHLERLILWFVQKWDCLKRLWKIAVARQRESF